MNIWVVLTFVFWKIEHLIILWLNFYIYFLGCRPVRGYIMSRFTVQDTVLLFPYYSFKPQVFCWQNYHHIYEEINVIWLYIAAFQLWHRLLIIFAKDNSRKKNSYFLPELRRIFTCTLFCSLLLTLVCCRFWKRSWATELGFEAWHSTRCCKGTGVSTLWGIYSTQIILIILVNLHMENME